MKWSSRNNSFEDKKRTGRPKILNEAAERILNKANYKRRNSTRQLSQKLAIKGWRPLRRKKKPVLTAKQRAARLKFANSTKTSLRKNRMIFFFRTNVPNICFSCPIQKMILFGVLRRAKFLQHISG